MAKRAKGGICAASTAVKQRSWGAQCARGRRSGTNEVGNGAEKNFVSRGIRKAVRGKRLLLLQEAKCKTRRAGLPDEKEVCGKRDESLGIAVAPIEATKVDGGQKSAVQQESGQVGQRFTEAAAEEKKKNKPVDSGELVSEETEPEKTKNESDAADEEIPAGYKLLSIEGFLNGFSVKFLIDSGATECFVSTTFVEKKELGLNKRKEKVKINLADGTTRVSQMYVK